MHIYPEKPLVLFSQDFYSPCLPPCIPEMTQTADGEGAGPPPKPGENKNCSQFYTLLLFYLKRPRVPEQNSFFGCSRVRLGSQILIGLDSGS